MSTDSSYIKLLNRINDLNWHLNDESDVRQFLQRVVEATAEYLDSAVSSAYLYNRSENTLKLAATVGLNPDLAGNLFLEYGTGVVGIALKEMRVICEEDASRHPGFKLINNLYEEPYGSFLAVPVVRGLERIGVLVAQRETYHKFEVEDVSVMKVVSGQLANILAGYITPEKAPANEGDAHDSESEEIRLIKGKRASKGSALGTALVDNKDKLFHDFRKYENSNDYTEDDLKTAVETTKKQLIVLQEDMSKEHSDIASMIFKAHLMFLRDNNFTGEMIAKVKSGEPVVGAVISVAEKFIRIFDSNPNPVFREKSHDIRDVALRLLFALVSKEHSAEEYKDKIVISKEMLPSDIVKMHVERAAGIILETGGITSHLSILARSLRIPMIIARVSDNKLVGDGTQIFMDADMGNVYIEPDQRVLDTFAKRDRERDVAESGSDVPDHVETEDGVRVFLYSNINLLTDIESALSVKTDGIGLYRTEFPFLIRSRFPSEEEQYEIYKNLFAKMEGYEITVRTLDIGGDKLLSYVNDKTENNPFLGLRSIRFTFKNMEVFRHQVRAILRASCGASLRIMFPMISSVDDFCQASEIVHSCIRELKEEGVEHNIQPLIGSMVEIPALLGVIDTIAQMADFLSIGTNDFIQYMLAVDRTNQDISDLYIPHHPSVLRGIKKIAEAGERFDTEVSVCGDMANNLDYIKFFIGCGIHKFSVDSGYIPELKRRLPDVSEKEAIRFSDALLECDSISDVEKKLGF